MGHKYIPVLYCKFVNQYWATDIVTRFSFMNNPLNKYGMPFKVCENLTFERRSIWETVKDKLVSYPYKWVKNGQKKRKTVTQ